MARLGVFYALSDEQVDAIAEQDDDKMYAYMLNTIEEIEQQPGLEAFVITKNQKMMYTSGIHFV